MFTCQHLTKSIFHTLILLCTVVAFTACGDKDNAVSHASALESSTPVKADTKAKDERFMVQAAEFDYEQIMIGKLARQRATSAEVRDFATMMEESHRNTKSELGSMGIIKSIAVPSAPTQAAHDAYDQLNAMTIEEFDKAYLARVIESHDQAIILFEGCAKAEHDPEIQALAAGRVTDLRLHMAKAIELEAKFSPLSELIK
jgi:putative membrane protein